MKINKKIVISGMRPTGRVHLGNYHSVIKNWISLQNKYDCFFFVADIHALTTHHEESTKMNEYKKLMIIDWLASGVDHTKCNIFIQSSIPEILELNVLLSMIVPISWLEQLPTYKDLSQNNIKYKTYGFLGYPILQCSDILSLNANYVPIGEDQLPHIEISRRIIRKLNLLSNKLQKKDLLVEPKALLYKYKKILGTDGYKMSKSKNNTILISDSPENIIKKIRKTTTDPKRIHIYNKGNPENCTIWKYHLIYSTKANQVQINDACKNANIGCYECKNILQNDMINKHNTIIDKINFYQKNDTIINDILHKGELKVRSIANKTLNKIKNIFNLV